MTDNPIHKILHEDYGLIYGEHYTEAYVVGTKKRLPYHSSSDTED